MTSLLIAGYLAVSNGRRISSENPNTKKSTSHVYYDTIIQTSGVDVGAEIRFWAPSTDPLYADGTVLDLLGKVYAPPNGTLHIDAIQVTPFPGDPTADAYEDQIPDRPFPTLFVLGHSSGNPDTMDDGSIGYYVQTSEYVRDQSRTSRVYSARRTNPFAGGTELSGSAPFENADDGDEMLSSSRSVPTSARGKKAGATKRKAARRVEPDENEE